MAYKDQQEFINVLEQNGELVRIKEFVDPHLQITEITDRISKANGPALLFENTGKEFPLLINAMGSEKRMALALGVERLDDLAKQIEELFKSLTSPKQGILDKLKVLPKLGQIASWMPKTKNGRGACQKNIMTSPDINRLPVMTCWPEDGGPFLTLPVIQTMDPQTGIRNVGLYRMQVFGPDLTALHWHKHKVSARHFNEYKKLNKRMPVVVTLGGDPVYSYSATAPLPDGVDEFMLAGFIRKKHVELVKCISQDLYVPSDVDFVIEGYVDPDEELILEGPFGDHTGFYSLADYYPRFHITAITYKDNAVYPSTIVGIPPQEDAWIGKATERIFIAPIKMTMVPEIEDMVMPVEGVFHNMVIVKIKKDYPGQAIKVMNALWGAGQMMFTKMMIVVDGDVNIHNNQEVASYIYNHTNPSADIFFNQGPTDVLDHSCSTMAFGGKMGIDATKKLPEELNSTWNHKVSRFVDLITLQNQFPEIDAMDSQLLSQSMGIVFLSLKKHRKNHVKELAQKLLSSEHFSEIKLLIFMEPGTINGSIADAVWRFANNIDPKRDHLYVLNSFSGNTALALDGTRKTKELDGFERDWPNVLLSTEETIEQIDQIWEKLGLGPHLSSPSLKYKSHAYAGGAVAES